MLQLRRNADDKLILGDIHHAQNFFDRLFGLLGKRRLSKDEGMLFEPGGSIHTIGMRFPIDVLFLDKSGIILKSTESLLPNRLCFAPKQTKYVIEMSEKMISSHKLESGQMLTWS